MASAPSGIFSVRADGIDHDPRSHFRHGLLLHMT